MKMPILSVRDALVGFGTTFTSVNEDVAVRGFTNSILKSLENAYDDTIAPEDLVLFCVGEFDSDDGTISPCTPRALVHGTGVVSQYHANRKHNCDCCDTNSGGDLNGCN